MSFGKYAVFNKQIKRSIFGIYSNDIYIFNQRNRAAFCRFRADMTDAKAARREPSVSIRR